MAQANHVSDNRDAAVVSPIGTPAAAARADRAARNPEFARLWEEYAIAREVAWQLVKFRMERGLTQQQLAECAGTSHSHISRLESGQHIPSVSTLKKVAKVLRLNMAITFTPEERIAAD